MSEGDNLPATDGAVSSLVGDAAADKALLDSVIGDPNSIYHRGDGNMDGPAVQAYYRDLVRGELSAAPGAVAPPDGIDVDVPRDVTGYDLAGAPGSQSATAEDRDLIDQFLPVALKAGLGVQKVREGLGFVFTSNDLTPAAFIKFARTRGWSQGAIDVCLKWVAAQRAAAQTK